MNRGLSRLKAYPFERLAALLSDARAPEGIPAIALSIGEPRHEPPAFVLDVLRANLQQLGTYPATRGLPRLRSAMAQALQQRLLPAGALLDPQSMVLPVNGTREALFAFAQTVIDSAGHALVAMPNPFYQIYEGAALLAGAEPYFLNTTEATGYLPDLDAVPQSIWSRCRLLFLCSPGNPTGAVLSLEYLRRALQLAERYNFVIAADECYSDLYLDESQPAPSLLRAAYENGNTRFTGCVVFHSLSKRSSLPGLRSGLVAGDPELIAAFLRYRTYHGCAMPMPTQLASVAAWSDEKHVTANRRLYQQKFDRVLPILQDVLPLSRPAGGFYLWPRVSDDDAGFARALYERTHLTILPGSYLAREHAGENPGRGRVRISLVPTIEQCVEAAQRLRDFIRAR
ncbi:MAG TPA: succinyldiaminopimelate transaminase [Steroidobacteraceae bacterium]|jgi:N-succinyldiaminopimelate aminotransferase|nr:succinyldiaminopimelate transaminase [Steroidobacteraceae bacterium]